MSEIVEVLKHHVKSICSFNRNTKNPIGLDSCLKYIENKLKESNGRVIRQEYIHLGNKYSNLIVKFGDDIKKTIIGCHYDTYGNSVGADDNASSCSFIIELAKKLKNENIEIVFFTNEEPPNFAQKSCGSFIYSNSIDFKNIKTMINIDMIGYYTENKKFIDVGVYNSKDILDKSKSFNLFHGLDLTNKRTIYDMADHMWFFPKGIPTIIACDGGPNRNPFYHTEQDIPETIDYVAMANVCFELENFIKNIV